MINSYIAKKLYIGGGRILGENVYKCLVKLKKNQWLSMKQLEEIQWIKFLAMVNHAYNFSPFYRKRFDEHGINPKRIATFDDVRRLPIITKTDLQNHYIEMVVSGRPYKYSIAKSSGSTGQAVKFFKDRNASSNGRAAMYLGHSWYGVDIGDREAKLWGVPFDFKERTMAYLGDYLLNRFRGKNFQLTEKTLNDFYRKIESFKPVYLMGYSSLVYEFANFLQSYKIDGSKFALKMVKVTAETLFDYQRKLIENVFQCPVINEYGAAEVGIIAFECPCRGLHSMPEGVFIEEHNAEIGKFKEFIITDLDNFYSPIIRYQIGDYGRLSKRSCRCGRGLPLLESIVGRTSDIVYKSDGSPVHSSVFSYILKNITGKNGGIKQYKVYQKEKGHLEIEYIKGKNFNKNTLDLLFINTKKQLGEDIKITTREVEIIEREKSGKLRYFVSVVK